MKKRRSVIRCWLITIGIMLLCGSLLITYIYFSIRPIIFAAAKSRASRILMNSAAESMLKVLKEENITYNGISRVSRFENGEIKGIEIDIAQIGLLKNRLATEISKAIAEKENYTVDIALGTLTGMEFVTGMGPRLNFGMQLAAHTKTDYKSKFLEAGINQTLHQILISVDMNCSIMMLGFTEGFSVSTTEIAAQTLIVGAVPDTFTNVVETPTDDLADEIFNFADMK